MKSRKATTTSRTFLTLLLIFWICLLVNSNVNAQCTSHDPKEKGKNLYTDMIDRPPRRWTDPTMTFHVQNTAKYWYGADITFAKNLWNNSSYKGTSASFQFVEGRTTTAPLPQDMDDPLPDSDLLNVIGTKDLGPTVGAKAATIYNLRNGKIFECDIAINSVIYTHIQPHRLAGNNDICVQNVLCHEFGHALGLMDLYPDSRSRSSGTVEYMPDTMYYFAARGEHKKESLECDDKWGTYYTYDSGKIQPPTAPAARELRQEPPQLTLLERQGVPIQTRLVGNYPNPFNPETWIAYTLSEDSDISIQIYDSKGEAIRWLPIVNKQAGVYIDKNSAAHWDGRTDNGEEVTSGIYFYSLDTGSSIYTKKMIIVK